MEAMDGNAIAGRLYEVFGADLTAATCTCAHCGGTCQVAELRVYAQAPGTVVGCPSCQATMMVLVTIRGTTCVDLRGLDRLDLRL